MKQKINVAELLKDCPKGMELDCTMYEGMTLIHISDGNTYPIKIETPGGPILLNEYGCYSHNKHAKCIIFPKGKTTWEKFQRPFKDGDVITCNNGTCTFTSIFKEKSTEKSFKYHCAFILDYNKFGVGIADGDYANPRFASEEEKQELFAAIKENGYKWDAKTKTLEKLIKPKFKVGDIIQNKDVYKVKITEVNVEDECYGYESMIAKGIGGIAFTEQEDWELVLNKFDISTLVPFKSRVLVRDDRDGLWMPDFWGFYDNENTFPYVTTGSRYKYCIPYNNNEYLLGKTDACNEFYKTW